MERLLISLAAFLTVVRSQCNRVDWNGNPVAANICFYYQTEQRYLMFDCATQQLRHFGNTDHQCTNNYTVQAASNANWHCNYNKTCGFLEVTNCHAVGGIHNASQLWQAQALDYCNPYNSGNATNGTVVTLSSDIYECCQDKQTIRHTFFIASDTCEGRNFSVELSASCQVPKNSNSKIEIRAVLPKCDPAKLVKCLGVSLSPTRYPTSAPVGNTTIIPSNSSTTMSPNSNTTMNPNGTTTSTSMAPTGNGTTVAPGNGTTMAPGNGTTMAPGNTTVNPNATTTTAPNSGGGGGSSKSNGPNVVLIVFLVIAGVLVLLFCIVFIVWKRRQSGVTVDWGAYGSGGDTGYAPLQQDGTGGGTHQEDVQ